MATIFAQRLIRQAALAALESANLGATVYSPGDWNVAESDLPAILIRSSGNRKEAIAKATANFTTTVTVEIEAKLQATSMEGAQDAIEVFGDEIEQALFTNADLMQLIQNIPSVATRTEVSSEGREHIGAMKMSIDFELMEEFVPADPPALTNFQIHVDTTSQFDQSGTYPNPPFPNSINPAPRTSGPDGRDEGGLNITLPQ